MGTRGEPRVERPCRSLPKHGTSSCRRDDGRVRRNDAGVMLPTPPCSIAAHRDWNCSGHAMISIITCPRSSRASWLPRSHVWCERRAMCCPAGTGTCVAPSRRAEPWRHQQHKISSYLSSAESGAVYQEYYCAANLRRKRVPRAEGVNRGMSALMPSAKIAVGHTGPAANGVLSWPGL